MKNTKKEKKKKTPFIQTKTRLDGGKEVELKKSPSETGVGKFFAIAIAFITMFGSLIALIYLLTQL